MGSLGIVGAGAFACKSGQDFQVSSADESRKRILFDDNWRFHLDDVKEAQKLSFMPSAGENSTWSIEGNFSKDNPSGWSEAFLPSGIGWYRKIFPWNPSWKDRKISVDFDGVYMNSDVWINGHHLGHRPYGFISFCYDLTP